MSTAPPPSPPPDTEPDPVTLKERECEEIQRETRAHQEYTRLVVMGRLTPKAFPFTPPPEAEKEEPP